MALLTLSQRVAQATALLRAYAASVAVECIRQQRTSVCSPALKESLRWLLLTLEQLHVGPAYPVEQVYIVSVMGSLAPDVLTPEQRAAASSNPDPETPLAFTEDDRFALLQEAARRYPLLDLAVAPFDLFDAHRLDEPEPIPPLWVDEDGDGVADPPTRVDGSPLGPVLAPPPPVERLEEVFILDVTGSDDVFILDVTGSDDVFITTVQTT